MKYIITLLFIITVNIAQAQLTITPNASLYFAGTSSVMLENMSLVNNGSFFPDSSVVTFAGTGNNSISGSGNISFCRLHIVKQGEVILQRPISIINRIVFFEGHLFLGNHNVDLGRTAIVDDEGETERIRTTGTGQVIAVRNIDGGLNVNPGNLGLIISTGANLGDVMVRRGHLAQSGTGLTTSIHRYYDVIPELTPANINATLRLNYFGAELNGIGEQGLQVYHWANNIVWTPLGSSTNDGVQNYVSRSSIQSLGRFTLGGPTGTLPVQFVNISGRCEVSKSVITWQTAEEQNSLQFDVQRGNGNSWTTIGNTAASGNSTTLKSYSSSDNNRLSDAFYRIVEKSIDGRLRYSSVLHLTCATDDGFKLWPNPASTQITLQFNSNSNQQVAIQLHDSKGALVKEKMSGVLKGVNSVPLNISDAAAGIYTVLVITNEGQRLYNTTFIKQ
jgi:hypothetical protein